MFRHGLERFLGLVFIGGQKLQDDVLIGKDLLIELLLLLGDILVELSQLAQLVLVMFDLRVEEEARAFFLEGALLLLAWVDRDVRLGKKR